jgi:hypothetical protein
MSLLLQRIRSAAAVLLIALDTSFGSGGKLTLAGVDVGQGLVRQADGRIVVGGLARNNVDGYGLARINP